MNVIEEPATSYATQSDSPGPLLPERDDLAIRVLSAMMYDVDVRTGDVLRTGSLDALVGGTANEVTSQMGWWESRIHPDERGAVVGAFRRATSDDEASPPAVIASEYRVRHQDGSWRTVWDQATVVRDASGCAVRVVGSIMDITERKQSEFRLQRDAERLRRLADLTIAINVVSDDDEVLQRAAEALVQLCDADRVHGAVARGGRRITCDVVRTAVSHVADDHTGADGGDAVGEPVVTAAAYSPLRVVLSRRDGSPLGDLVLTRGASPFTSNELSIAVQIAQVAAVTIENIHLLDALRDADRRKDHFLATLAHELRNPLTPIVNAVAMLDRVAASHTGVARARETIDRQSQQLVRLIDDLIDVSRVTQDRLELRCEVLPLRDVFDIAFEAVRPLLIEHNLHLTANLPAEPIYLSADPTRLTQVLTNIFNNAVHYTDPDGDISVDVTMDATSAHIEVSDTGIGIPEEQLDHVFEMFAHVYDRGNRTPVGLGIGLALARRLVELHGGSMTARSAGVGLGSTFHVTLPRLPLADARHPRSSTAGTDAPSVSTHREPALLPMTTPRFVPLVAGRRVLVVDDNVDAADSLALLLEREGHQVQVAYDGETAVQMYTAFHQEAVVMDIGLPLIDGYDAARAMRDVQGDRELLLVALTGWGQGDDRRKSQAAGFDHHLVKPVSPRVIHTLVVENTRGGQTPP